MGIKVDFEVKKHGLFPDVVGEIELDIQSMKDKGPLKPIEMTARGDFKSVDLYVSYTTGSME